MILPGVIASSGGVASSYESIATYTIGSGGSSSITFSSMGTGFTHLQIRIMSKGSGLVNPTMIFNADTGANYADHVLYGDGATAASSANINYTVMLLPAVSSAQPGCMIIDILDAFNTSKFNTVRALGGFDANGSGYVQLFSNLWRSTTAVSSINFAGTTFAQYSSFALYGVL